MDDIRLKKIERILDTSFPKDSIIYDFSVASGYNQFGVGPRFFVNTINCPILKLVKGQQYIFDLTDTSVSGYPLAFSTETDGTNSKVDSNDFIIGFTKYGKEATDFGYISVLIPESEPSFGCFYYSKGNSYAGNIAYFVDKISDTTPAVTTLEPVIKLPEIGRNDPSSIFCETQGACVKPTGKGRRSDIRFNPPGDSFLDEYNPPTTIPLTTSTTTTTTTFSPDVNPYNEIVYPTNNISPPSRIDNLFRTLNPEDFNISSPDSSVFTYDDYKSFAFYNNSQITIEYSGEDTSPYIDMEYFIIGGGGGGGEPGFGGGGGAGAVASGITRVTPGTYVVLVGEGGSPNQFGGNSSFNFNVAFGGGPGGSYLSPPVESNGSTGGAGGNSSSGPIQPTISSSDTFTSAGGGSLGSDFSGGGGGGGAGSSANTADNDDESRFIGTNGGNGILTDFADGIPRYYAGGGGGGGSGILLTGQGGQGGGGSFSSPNGENNTGSGGVGANGSFDAQNAGSGGDGLVILRYNTKPPKIFDPLAGDFLNIVDVQADKKNVTVFFNPNNQSNNVEYYYLDYKKSSSPYFSPLKTFKGNSNTTYIQAELPSYGSYDIRISILHRGVTYSGPKTSITLYESSNTPEIKTSVDSQNNITLDIINRFNHKNLFVEYSYDNITWNRLIINDSMDKISLPSLEFFEESVTLNLKIGKYIKNETFFFNNLSQPIVLNKTSTNVLLDAPQAVINESSGGLKIEFTATESSLNTLIRITNTTSQEVFNYVIDNDKSEKQKFIFTDAKSIKDNPPLQETYNIKLYSVNDFGVGNSYDAGNFQNGVLTTSLNVLSFSEKSGPLTRTNYKLVLIDSNSEIPKSDIKYLKILVDGKEVTVYPEDFDLEIENNEKYITYNLDLENNLDIKTISSFLVYDGDIYSGSLRASEDILFDPSSIEIFPNPVEDFRLVGQEDLYQESYQFNLNWSNSESNRYELIVWVFKNTESIPENDSSALLSADKTIIDLVNTNEFLYYYDKIIQEDSTFIFGIRSKNEWGVGPISYVRKNIEYIKPISPPTKLTINSVNKKVTLSWSPPSRLGSFDDIYGYRIYYTKSSINSTDIEYVDLPSTARTSTFNVPVNGNYSFSISSVGAISQNGITKKYLGPARFANIFVEDISIPDPPELRYVKFSDYDELEISVKHINPNTNPENGPVTSGYSLIYSTQDSRIDHILSIPPIEPVNQNKENDIDFITIKFPTVPDKIYSFSVTTNTDKSVSEQSRSLSLTSPGGNREPDPPILDSYFPITNGIKIKINPPEYTGWSSEYFADTYDKLDKYLIYYKEKHSEDWNEIITNTQEDYYYITGLDPYSEYEVYLKSKNKNYYSESSEIFQVGSPIKGLRIELDNNLNIVANGNDSENSYTDSLNPNFTFYYGQLISISYLVDSAVYFDNMPRFPYSDKIECLKKNKSKPIPSSSSSINNSIDTLNVSETKIFQAPAPGRYYYRAKPISFSQINLNKFSYVVPSNNYLLVKALRVEPKLIDDNNNLLVEIHGEDFSESSIAKFKLFIRSGTRDQEILINSDPKFIYQTFPIENEKINQDLISISVYAYDVNDQFIVKSEQHFIKVYNFPHSISDLKVEAYNCDHLLLSLGDAEIHTDSLNQSSKILRSPINTKYTYSACFYDEEPYISSFKIEDSAGSDVDVEVELRKNNNSYSSFNITGVDNTSIKSSSYPPYLTNFVLYDRNSLESRNIKYTMYNSINSSQSLEYNYSPPSHLVSGVAFVCRYDVDSNTTSNRCVDFCSIKETDEVVSVFGFIDSGNTAFMQCSKFPTESEEDKQLVCDRLFNITTTNTTTTTTAPPEITTTIDIVFNTTTTTVTTPVPLGNLPAVALPEYFFSIQDSNWEPSLFFPELNLDGETIQLTEAKVPVQIFEPSIVHATKYIRKNASLGNEDFDVLSFGSTIVKGTITNSTVSYKIQKSKFPTGNKIFYHCSSREGYTHTADGCTAYPYEILTSTLMSTVYVDSDDGEMVAAYTYYTTVDENSNQVYYSFVLSKEYVEDIMAFLGISNVNDLGEGLDTGEIDGSYKSFPIVYREKIMQTALFEFDDPQTQIINLRSSRITGIAMTYRVESYYDIQAFVEITIEDEDPIPIFVTANNLSGKFGHLTYPVPSIGIGFLDDVYVQNTSTVVSEDCRRSKHINISNDAFMNDAIFNFPVFTNSEEKTLSTTTSEIGGREYTVFTQKAGTISLPKQYNLPNIPDFDFSRLNSTITQNYTYTQFPPPQDNPVVRAFKTLNYSIFEDNNGKDVAFKVYVSQNGNVFYNTIFINGPPRATDPDNYISEELFGIYENISLRFNSFELTMDVSMKTLGSISTSNIILRSSSSSFPMLSPQTGTINKI